MSMNIKPLSNYIFVEPIKEEKISQSGIIIPETAEEKPMVGIIIALGSGKITEEGKLLPMAVKEGDKVLFTKYSPHEIKIGNKEYLVIREDDILAIIN